MDQKSLHTLEFHKILDRLASFTSFSAGGDLVRNLIPTIDIDEARRWQAETAEARHLFEIGSEMTIGGARDVRRAADNAERGFTLPVEELIDIRGTIVAARNLRRVLLKVEDRAPALADVALLIEDCPGIVSAISSTIDDAGEVMDSASPKLAKVRQEQRIVHGRIQDKLQRLLNSSMNQYLQEPIITQRGGRYVVPVKAGSRGRIPGIVHDQSGSGATVWVEPMNTVEINNQYRGLLIEEQDEIQRILRELSGLVAEQADVIKRIVDRMAEIDLIFARARYALELNGVTPEFVPWRDMNPPPPKHANQQKGDVERNYHPGSTIWVKGARHPLLDPSEVVPTNLTLAEELFIVLITGPNTGGKTVSLKTTGLMVLMAQSGLQLPAIEARLTIFDNVFADIGDEQSIEQSLSTFSAHLTNMITILKKVDERSLVLLDELGSGTDPAEGAAIAQSITNFLRDKGATTFIATHYPELKLYASETPGATNASLLFDVETLSPTYEMTIGLPGRSNAVAIARRLGLDESILDDALRLLGQGNQTAGSMLDSIYDLREKIETQEAQTRLALREAERERDGFRQRMKDIEEERRFILAEAQQTADSELEALRDEIQQLRKRLRGAESLNAIKKVSRAIDDVGKARVLPLAPEPIKIKEPGVSRKKLSEGDAVKVTSLNTKGTILSLNDKDAVIAVGNLHMRVKYSELEFDGRPITEETGETAVTEHIPIAPSPGIELDLRGERIDSGVERLEQYLDNAFLARLPWVRIIHGKGTGRLRTAVRKALSSNGYVQSWEEGKASEGGAGVTVAKLAGQA